MANAKRTVPGEGQGRCGVCGYVFSVNADGKLRKHKNFWLNNASCQGSGGEALDDHH
jgi:hypothetical protein